MSIHQYLAKNIAPINRDKLLLQVILIDDFEVKIEHVMKPVFDTIWNTAKYPQSLNYDNEGSWKGLNPVGRDARDYIFI